MRVRQHWFRQKLLPMTHPRRGPSADADKASPERLTLRAPCAEGAPGGSDLVTRPWGPEDAGMSAKETHIFSPNSSTSGQGKMLGRLSTSQASASGQPASETTLPLHRIEWPGARASFSSVFITQKLTIVLFLAPQTLTPNSDLVSCSLKHLFKIHDMTMTAYKELRS